MLTALALLPAGGQEVALTVDETFVTTGEGNGLDPFATISAAVQSPTGDIWVADPSTRRLVALDRTGDPLRVVASGGPGPGEIEAPSWMARMPDGRGVAVYDQDRNTIEKFGPDGDFRERVHIRLTMPFLKGFAALPDGGFVMSGGAVRREASVFVIRPDGDLGPAFLPRTPVEGEGRLSQYASVYLAGGALHPTSPGELLYSRASPHEIARLDLSDGEKTVVAADPNLLEFPGAQFFERESDGHLDPRFEYPRSVFVAAMPGGKILNVVRWQEDDRSLFQLYGPGGRLLDSLETDRAYTPFHLTGNGRLLASYRRPGTGEQVLTALAISY